MIVQFKDEEGTNLSHIVEELTIYTKNKLFIIKCNDVKERLAILKYDSRAEIQMGITLMISNKIEIQ